MGLVVSSHTPAHFTMHTRSGTHMFRNSECTISQPIQLRHFHPFF